MRTIVTLDDSLLSRAVELTGITERGVLLRDALTALIERESARRLARLGGSEPEAQAPPRRRVAGTDAQDGAPSSNPDSAPNSAA